MITSIRRPTLTLPKPILIQSLLHKTNNYLTQPATTSLVLQMEKNLSKTTATKINPAKNEKQCTKNVSLIIFILYLLYNGISRFSALGPLAPKGNSKFEIILVKEDTSSYCRKIKFCLFKKTALFSFRL